MTSRLGRRGRSVLGLTQPLHSHVVALHGQLQRQLRTNMPVVPLGRQRGLVVITQDWITQARHAFIQFASQGVQLVMVSWKSFEGVERRVAQSVLGSVIHRLLQLVEDHAMKRCTGKLLHVPALASR
eukprot:3349705-Pyramimonas_sp.AAC.1